MSAGKDREPGFEFDPCSEWLSMRFRDSSEPCGHHHADFPAHIRHPVDDDDYRHRYLRESRSEGKRSAQLHDWVCPAEPNIVRRGIFHEEVRRSWVQGVLEGVSGNHVHQCDAHNLASGRQQASGVCEQPANATENGMPANCNLMHAGQAPVPSLMGTIITPSMLAVIFGMQWVPVVGVFVIMNVPAVYYVHTHQAVEQGVCMMSYLVCSGIVLMMTAAVIKQERETFVWRKVALSEKKVELERTFNAFLCHEIRNPFAVIKGFAECVTFPDVEPSVSPPRSRRVLGAINQGDGGNNRQLVQHILDSCTHIQRILDNSLDLGKLEQHKLVLDDDAVNIKIDMRPNPLHVSHTAQAGRAAAGERARCELQRGQNTLDTTPAEFGQ